MITQLCELLQKTSKRCLYIDYISVERIFGDPGVVSLEKNSDLVCSSWFLSTNSHSKLLTCHILEGLSSSDMQRLRHVVLAFHSDIL